MLLVNKEALKQARAELAKQKIIIGENELAEAVHTYLLHAPADIGRIARLVKAAEGVEEWWLRDGKKRMDGAPWCIFAIRSALDEFRGKK